MTTVPRYREIADDLRAAIINGLSIGGITLSRDAQLPSHTELERAYGVSRETIRNAVGELVAEGLLVSRGREGIYVRNLSVLPHPVHVTPYYEEWATRAKAIGEPSSDFEMSIVPASNSVAARLEIQAGELIVVRKLLRRIDSTPWSVEESCYPLDVAQKAGLDSPRNIPTGTMTALENAGLKEEGWRFEVSARFATPEEQNTLAMGAGAALIICTDTARSGTRPVRDTTELLPADRNVIVEHYPFEGGM